jgi:hypothetical protein
LENLFETVFRVDLRPQISVERYEQTLERLGPLDALREMLVRTEQAFLRNRLLGNRRTANCEICGRLFPVEYIVAAHIKRRSACSDEERRDDRRNVVAMCKFGCDQLFERGIIAVVSGRVVPHGERSTAVTPAVDSYLSSVEGRECPHWQEGQPYFEWHARMHGFQS